MVRQSHDFLATVRTTAAAGALLLAIVATTTGPAITLVAQAPGLPNYSYDTHYDIVPGATAAFDQYWALLRDLSLRGTPGLRRHLDGAPDGLRRVVRLPVTHLSEYGFDRRNESELRAQLGAVEADRVFTAFTASQVVRTSYIRQFRAELSLNRDQDRRMPAVEIARATVVPGREREFEALWRRALEGYRRVDAAGVLSGARTLVGGGPQFVITRPLPAVDAGSPLEPLAVVRRAFGERDGAQFEVRWRGVVSKWEVERLVNLGLDTTGVSVVSR